MAKLQFVIRISEEQEKTGNCAICPLCPGRKANQKHYITDFIINTGEKKELIDKLTHQGMETESLDLHEFLKAP